MTNLNVGVSIGQRVGGVDHGRCSVRPRKGPIRIGHLMCRRLSPRLLRKTVSHLESGLLSSNCEHSQFTVPSLHLVEEGVMITTLILYLKALKIIVMH